MSGALEAALECFAGRRTAQGDLMRHRFAVLPSRQEPRYLLPLGDSRTTLEGLQVYTPYALGARLRKGLLAQLVKTGWSGWAMHSLHVGEPVGLKALVTNVTGERNPAFAMWLGSPGKYRKLTIQVMRAGGETLGYIKLGLTKPAGDRVRRRSPRTGRPYRIAAARAEGALRRRMAKQLYVVPVAAGRQGLDRQICPACMWIFSKNWRPSGAWISPGSRSLKKLARAGTKSPGAATGDGSIWVRLPWRGSP